MRKRTKTTTKIIPTFIIFLYLIFLVTVIPTIYVYIEHANIEKDAFEKAKTETKKIKTLSEALIFYGIGVGYIIASFFMFLKPKNGWKLLLKETDKGQITTPELAKRKLPLDGKGLESEIRMHGATNKDTKMKWVNVYEITPPSS